MGLRPDPVAARRAAVSHDRDDRGRARPRPPARQAGSATGAAAELADAIRTTLDAGDPVVVTGCGTSEHAALAAAEILREAAAAAVRPDWRGPVIWSEQAFELSLDAATRGLVIGVTHEGATGATNAALRAARDAGRPTAVITVSRRSPAGALAGIVVETASSTRVGATPSAT